MEAKIRASWDSRGRMLQEHTAGVVTPNVAFDPGMSDGTVLAASRPQLSEKAIYQRQMTARLRD